MIKPVWIEICKNIVDFGHSLVRPKSTRFWYGTYANLYRIKRIGFADTENTEIFLPTVTNFKHSSKVYRKPTDPNVILNISMVCLPMFVAYEEVLKIDLRIISIIVRI